MNQNNDKNLPKLIFKIFYVDNKFLIRVYLEINGVYYKILKPDKYLVYGKEIFIGDYSYRITLDDIQKYNSIRSLNPIIKDDGDIILDIFPSLLKYIRQNKDKFIEKDTINIEIKDEEIIPTFKADYDKKKKRLEINFGYSKKDGTEFYNSDFVNKNKTKDNYIKINNIYFKVKEEEFEFKEKYKKGIEFIPIDKIPEFFKKDFVLLKSKLRAVLTDEASKINILDEDITPRVEIDKKKRDWFEFKITYKFKDKLVNFDDLKDIDSDYILIDDYNFVRINKEKINKIKRKLSEIVHDNVDGTYRVPINEYFSFQEFLNEIGGEEILSESYKKFISELKDFQPNENFRLSEDLERRLIDNGIFLRPYQRAGISWIYWLAKHNLHGILADDMGLGKTIQTILGFYLIMLEDEEQGNILVITPKSVVEFWRREIERVIKKDEFCIYEYLGPNRDHMIFLNNTKPSIFLTTYETISRDIDDKELYKIPFHTIILDEATKIKNVDALRTKSIKRLNSLHRFVLTGTPIENRPLELWSIFDFLMKKHLGEKSRFLQIEKEIVENKNDYYINLLIKKIKPFILRRKKEDVAKDLPDKIVMEEWCELTEEQLRIYKNIIDNVKKLKELRKLDYITVSNYISTLKQLCIHPALVNNKDEPILGRSEKFDIAFQILNEIIDGGEKCVIFSQYLKPLNLIEKLLIKDGIKYIKISGVTQNRQDLIDKFNNYDEYKVALVSLRAGGHGITLTGANHVLHLDMWWNPAVIDQATDRVHRIGQKKNVFVYNILIKNSVEEKILDLVRSKRELSSKIMDTIDIDGARFTKEELIEILTTNL